jgi:hypothetical protein
MRGKKVPLLRGAVVGIGLGLQDNIIIHSVNNILILLSMINSANVKNNNNNNKLQIANRKNTYYVSHYFLRYHCTIKRSSSKISHHANTMLVFVRFRTEGGHSV